MAVLTKIHCNLSVITASKEDINIRPFIDGSDVSITSNGLSGTNAQGLVDNIGKTAYIKKFEGIGDSKGLQDDQFCYSINRIKEKEAEALSAITKCKTDYPGWF